MAEITIALSLGSAAVTGLAFAGSIYYAYRHGKAAGVTEAGLLHARLELEEIREQTAKARKADEEFQEERDHIASSDLSGDIDSVWGGEADREEDTPSHASFRPVATEA